MSADGSTLAIGVRDEDSSGRGVGAAQNDAVANSGAVYVFRRSAAGTWTQEAYVKASNADAGDGFGASVDLSANGSVLLVGAPGESSSARTIDGDANDNGRYGSGAAYVFRRSAAGSWTQEAYVKASDAEASDGFGAAVSVNGTGEHFIVGIPGRNARRGAARRFTQSAGHWIEQGGLIARADTPGDAFGGRVEMSGDGGWFAIAAIGEDSSARGVGGTPGDDGRPDSGAVFVFLNGGVGGDVLEAYVKAPNADAYDGFGTAIALSQDGSRLVVSADHEDSASRSIGGDATDNSSADAGAAYVFVRNSALRYTFEAYLKASNADPNDLFGYSVAITASGDRIIVGAPNESSNARRPDGDATNNSRTQSGAVYEFVRDAAGGWTQDAYVKAPNADGGDYFGIAVATSADGSRLVVGAADEDSAAAGVDGDMTNEALTAAGAAYVFR